MHVRTCASVAAWSFTSVASAATHTPSYTPVVLSASVANPSFHDKPNTMMYTVTATVDDTYDDEHHDGVVGFTTDPSCGEGVDYQWSPHTQRYLRNTDTRTWTLYNLQPGVQYYYAVRTGIEGSYQYHCGDLGTPTLPQALDDLDLVVDNSSDAYHTKYVVFDTDDCAGVNYLVAVDADSGNIVWYLDIEAVSGAPDADVNGWRYHPRGTRFLNTDRLLATVNTEDRRTFLFELEFDGTIVQVKDFNQAGEGGHGCDGSGDESTGPCPHHDAFKSDRTGQTWVLVSADSGRGTDGNPFWTPDLCTDPAYGFMTDGFQVLDRNYAELFTQYLDPDLGHDPAVDGGPAAPAGCAVRPDWSGTLRPDLSWIDWFHVNTVALTENGRFVDISIRNWNQVIRVRADGSSTEPVWRLSGDPTYSDYAMATEVAGPPTFGWQHDVHMIDTQTMMLYDNKGNPGSETDTWQSRVLQIRLRGGASPLATIEKSWALVSNDGSLAPLSCPTRGSGQLVPGGGEDSVLTICHASRAIEELNDPTGALTAPALYIGLSSPPEDACISSTGFEVDGWYRAYPLERLGDFP
jgi:hypothetical protein